MLFKSIFFSNDENFQGWTKKSVFGLGYKACFTLYHFRTSRISIPVKTVIFKYTAYKSIILGEIFIFEKENNYITQMLLETK